MKKCLVMLTSKIVFSVLLWWLIISTPAFSQLSLQQLINVNLGETFSESKGTIKSMFSQKGEILKADFFGAYKIEFENAPFNYYGDADYTFQYLKDTLASVDVEFSFKAQDTIEFRRLYNTILGELKNDNSKKFLKQYSNLNSQKIFSYVAANCKTTTEKDDKNYKPINIKSLGQNFWAIYNGSFYTGRILGLFVQLGESHTSFQQYGKTIRYNGGEVEVTLRLYNEKYSDLLNKEEGMEIRNYHMIEDESEAIKLKYQNGVYVIPVKLNNIVTMDFVLDLGASDVSISPDVFLVLYRGGTIQESDFIGSETYQFADGTTAKSNVFNINTLQIGNKELKNVRASISNSLSAPLLLGQSALSKLGSYKIDNYQKLLMIE
jgi:aspartyl protease family protein